MASELLLKMNRFFALLKLIGHVATLLLRNLKLSEYFQITIVKGNFRKETLGLLLLY